MAEHGIQTTEPGKGRAARVPGWGDPAAEVGGDPGPREGGPEERDAAGREDAEGTPRPGPPGAVTAAAGPSCPRETAPKGAASPGGTGLSPSRCLH